MGCDDFRIFGGVKLIEGITRTDLRDERIDPHYRVSVIRDWDALGKPQRQMFLMVSAACKKLEAAGPPSAGEAPRDHWDYATRYEIAAELKKKRLNGSDIQRLDDLLSEGFLKAQERSNGHVDANGRWRPHNSSKVYKPIEAVMVILAEKAEKRLEAKITAPRPEPEKAVVVRKPRQPLRVPTLYEQYGMGNPDSDQEAKKPESVLKRFWGWLGEIDPFNR